MKEENILRTIQLSKKNKTRYLLGDVYPLIKKNGEQIDRRRQCDSLCSCSSFRRMKETIGDIDILVSYKRTRKSG
jgi:DNA polymerase (family 10)